MKKIILILLTLLITFFAFFITYKNKKQSLILSIYTSKVLEIKKMFANEVNKKRGNIRNNSDSTNKKSSIGRSGKPMEAKSSGKPSSKKSSEKRSRTLSANSGKSITPTNPGSAKSKKMGKDKYSHLKNK